MKTKKYIKIPNYSLSEELINSISHGVGAALAITGLVLMLVKSNSAGEYITCTAFATSMILLYTISCIYHALSPRIKGKKVLRVLDHCNVYLLVFGTYIPASLLGVGGVYGWLLFSFVATVTVIGITLTAVNLERFKVAAVICHLLNGWSILFGINILYENIGFLGVLFLIIGGIFYTVGSILYGIGSKIKYMHSLFHFFCLGGTIFHFFAIYLFML